jgi:hypothetical protein
MNYSSPQNVAEKRAATYTTKVVLIPVRRWPADPIRLHSNDVPKVLAKTDMWRRFFSASKTVSLPAEYRLLSVQATLLPLSKEVAFAGGRDPSKPGRHV